MTSKTETVNIRPGVCILSVGECGLGSALDTGQLKV